MKKLKILIAGCNNHILASNIQKQLEDIDCKVNIIGELNNIMVSVALDKPDIVSIHFHEFTHNALEISKQLNDTYNIPTIFLVNSDSFKEAVDLSELNVIACLTVPVDEEELTEIVEQYKVL